ncbi:hypothetical protein [Croceicoccus sediminis]|uniref:hypothetical protein n=1 Tax=Croceicoccus sediminis TaxID=2571150 RepID=UPI00196AD41F|nr:hypothetical protein [Croceicoccus sediminis]
MHIKTTAQRERGTMDGNETNSDDMMAAGKACFRFWFDDAKRAEDKLAARHGAATVPVSISYKGLEFSLRPASAGVDDAQFIAVNPIDLPEGPSHELIFAGGEAGSFAALAMVMTTLAAEIAEAGAARAVMWVPSGTVTGADFFVKLAKAWADGGAFPAMVLVALKSDGNAGLTSRGLDLFCGQELMLDLAPMAMPEQAKVAIRMIDHLVAEGPVTENEIVEVDGFGSFEIGPRNSGKNIYLRRTPFA